MPEKEINGTIWFPSELVLLIICIFILAKSDFFGAYWWVADIVAVILGVFAFYKWLEPELKKIKKQ